MRGIRAISIRRGACACAGAALAVAAPAAAQGSYSPYDETPGRRARPLRPHARVRPQGFRGADRRRQGRARAWRRPGRGRLLRPRRRGQPAEPAAAGRHGRGVGRQWRRRGGACPISTRAQQLGAPLATFGCDRGLAYDLLGQQAKAQADYRAALGGRDADEARRRLALSLAISGDKRRRARRRSRRSPPRAIPAVARVRAFVLALTGDSNGAMAAIDAAMPGSWSRVSPFLQRLPVASPPARRPPRSTSAFSRIRTSRLTPMPRRRRAARTCAR